MWRCASLDEIRIALFTELLDATEDMENVFVVAPAQDSDPDLRSIIIACSFTPGNVDRAELGGFGALAQRRGIWKMTLSTLKDADSNLIWELAERLERLFRQYTCRRLKIRAEEVIDIMPVYCDFPYAEDVGFLPDGRHGVTVTVPWWTWTQN